MNRVKGRPFVACSRCHSQKVKCSGDRPCRRCSARGRDCHYPIRDHLVTIPGSYIEGLERQVASLQKISTEKNQQPSTAQQLHSSPPGNFQPPGQLIEDYTTENFVQRLKALSEFDFTCNATPVASSDILISHPPGRAKPSNHSYTPLKFDSISSPVSLKLPPYPYTMHLFEIFCNSFEEYHWFLRQSFRERLEDMYKNPSAYSNDRNWLCKVSVLLALAESLTSSYETSSESPILDRSDVGITPPLEQQKWTTQQGRLYGLDSPPGTDLFDQGLLLLKISYEEPCIEQIEALNLIAFYCFSLNRRNTAYMYAGQSLRMANLLRLGVPPPQGNQNDEAADPVISEHRKRIWWTAYCIDRMVCSEIGLRPIHETNMNGLDYPSATCVEGAQDQFFNASLLKAHAELCQIRGRVIETITNHLDTNDMDHHYILFEECLEQIHGWRANLPVELSYTFEDGIPELLIRSHLLRSLISLYLRYHQCMIILIRPILLRDLARALQLRQAHEFESMPDPDLTHCDNRIESLKLDCLYMARCNANILVNLSRCGRIAKYGYWESLHLFSSLTILCLAKAVVKPEHRRKISKPPGYNDTIEQDLTTYGNAKEVFLDMATLGNPAAKDFAAMLADIERLIDNITAPSVLGFEQTQAMWNAGISNLERMDEQVWLDFGWDSILGGFT